jgi:protein ImuB
MPFACIFVPDFPVEALLRAEPGLRSQPLAVLEGKPPLQKVFAVNENARRAGVAPGMTKLQIEACPGLAFRTRSVLQEAAAHAALLDCAQSFSPRVEDAAPDTIALDLLGMELLFGTLPEIARDLAHRALDLGLNANVAVAANPDTAMLAARGFCGVTVIPEGKEFEWLGNLPVELVVAGEQDSEPLLETFQRWGIRNLRDLAALPDVPLSERLGQRGIYLQKLARGEISRTLVPADPPLLFEETIELEYPLTLLEPLAFLLSQLLDHLCSRLATRALATQELQLELELADEYREEETQTSCVGTGALARPGRARLGGELEWTKRL